MFAKINTILRNPSIKYLRDTFAGAIRLLYIEDLAALMDIVCDGMFVSPLCRCKTAFTLEEADRMLQGPKPFHCLILDLSLESHNDGLKLLVHKPYYYYCVALSGAQSMEDAAEAMKEGCHGVYDKRTVFTKNPHKFIIETCTLATLAFLLKGKKPSRPDMFDLLTQRFITSPNEWSEWYCLNSYSVRETCVMDSGLTAKQFLNIFHALRSILIFDCYVKPLNGINSHYEKCMQYAQCIEQCAEFVADNINAVYGPVYLKTYSPALPLPVQQ